MKINAFLPRSDDVNADADFGSPRNSAVTPALAGLSEARLAEVDRFMEKVWPTRKSPGGVVIVSHDGKIGFFHAYGLWIARRRKPMLPDTIFRIYSMSKAITTAAALTLCDAGRLGLDDPVSKYIPGSPISRWQPPMGFALRREP